MESARPRTRLLSTSLCLVAALILGAGTAIADSQSGPDRRTLHLTAWGAIYYPVGGASPVQATHGAEGTVLSRGTSRTVVDARFGGTYEIRHGHRSATVIEREGGNLDIRSGDRVISFRRSDRGLQVTAPNDRITYERTSDGFVVSGKSGRTRFLRGPSTYELRSARGITRFNIQSGGVVETLGLPASAHPYIGRAVYVSLGNAGVYVNVWQLAHLDRILGSLVPWQAALSVHLGEPASSTPAKPAGAPRT